MKVTLAAINEFFKQKNVAVFGVSRTGKKFGNSVYRELKNKGYNVFAVNPNADTIEDEKCYKGISELKDKVNSAVVAVNPKDTDSIVNELVQEGIKHIWMQKGSETKKAIQFCNQNGINVVYNQCVIMYLEPVEGFHKFHRTIYKIFGKAAR